MRGQASYFFDFRFFVAFRFFAAFFGTFLPLALASDSPIAIACLRLVTFFLEPSAPQFAGLALLHCALDVGGSFLRIFRAMMTSRLQGNNRRDLRESSGQQPLGNRLIKRGGILAARNRASVSGDRNVRATSASAVSASCSARRGQQQGEYQIYRLPVDGVGIYRRL